jgi:hypothetical protein
MPVREKTVEAPLTGEKLLPCLGHPSVDGRRRVTALEQRHYSLAAGELIGSCDGQLNGMMSDHIRGIRT